MALSLQRNHDDQITDIPIK